MPKARQVWACIAHFGLCAVLQACAQAKDALPSVSLAPVTAPATQEQRYDEFLRKIKHLVDTNRIGDPLYAKKVLGVEIWIAKGPEYVPKPPVFPDGSRFEFSRGSPATRYVDFAGDSLFISGLTASGCVPYEQISRVFGADFKMPPYGQPHTNWLPGQAPIPKGTFAGLSGIQKILKASPKTQLVMSFDYNGCVADLGIRQATPPN
jgi:hypothetical protein